MDAEAKKCLLELHETICKLALAQSMRTQGVTQALKCLTLALMKIFTDFPFAGDFSWLLDEMSNCLHSGSEEEMDAWETMHQLKMRMEGKTEAEISTFLAHEKMHIQAHIRRVQGVMAARMYREQTEQFFLAYFPPCNDLQ